MPRRLTTDDFINKSKLRHGNRYDYRFVEYKNSRNSVVLVCRQHGKFSQIANDHLMGAGCPKCRNMKTTDRLLKTLEQVITEFKELNGNRYDYTNILSYISSKEKLPIKCKVHGIFYQSANTHLRGYHCWDCGMTKRSRAQKNDPNKAIQTLIDKHGDTYLYDRVLYKGKKNPIEIGCRIHGYFWQVFNCHQGGGGCPTCGGLRAADTRRYSKEELAKKLKIIHGDRLTFCLENYQNQDSFLEVNCLEHGNYKQRVSNLLAGHGCPQCGLLSTAIRDDYLKICGKYDGNSHLYLVKMSLNDETFFKVGIARAGVKARFKDKGKCPYNYEIIYEIKGEAGIIWDFEKTIHKLSKEFHYTPKLYFKGHKNECFSEIPSRVLKLIKEFQDSNQLLLVV